MNLINKLRDIITCKMASYYLKKFVKEYGFDNLIFLLEKLRYKKEIVGNKTILTKGRNKFTLTTQPD